MVAGSAFYVQQDFEGATTPSGWTPPFDPYYTYATSPLEGAQSLCVNSVSDYAENILPIDSATLDVFFEMRINVASINSWQNVINIVDSSGTALCGGTLQQASTNFYLGSVTPQTIAYATKYYCWLHLASGVVEGYISTTSTKPGSPTWTGTPANANPAHAVRFFGSDPTYNFVIDKVRISSSTIGSNPL